MPVSLDVRPDLPLAVNKLAPLSQRLSADSLPVLPAVSISYAGRTVQMQVFFLHSTAYKQITACGERRARSRRWSVQFKGCCRDPWRLYEMTCACSELSFGASRTLWTPLRALCTSEVAEKEATSVGVTVTQQLCLMKFASLRGMTMLHSPEFQVQFPW